MKSSFVGGEDADGDRMNMDGEEVLADEAEGEHIVVEQCGMAI